MATFLLWLDFSVFKVLLHSPVGWASVHDYLHFTRGDRQARALGDWLGIMGMISGRKGIGPKLPSMFFQPYHIGPQQPCYHAHLTNGQTSSWLQCLPPKPRFSGTKYTHTQGILQSTSWSRVWRLAGETHGVITEARFLIAHSRPLIHKNLHDIYTHNRKAKKIPDNSKCQEGCRATRTPIYCCWECKHSPYGPAIPLLGSTQKKWKHLLTKRLYINV